MPDHDGVELTGVDRGDLPAFLAAFDGVFAAETPPDAVERFGQVAPLERFVAARSAAGEVVGTAGAYSFDLALPGGTRAGCAGITVVSVRADHRRRGLLTRMMSRLLDEAAERDEPFAALWASEQPIYGRYGFGPAAPTIDVEVARDHGALHLEGPVDQVRLVDATTGASEFPGLYEAHRAARPGALSYAPAWWTYRLLADPPSRRGGAGPLRYAWLPGRGYALYRMTHDWNETGPAGRVSVKELIALDPRAAAALWRFVIDTDLSSRTQAVRRPVDDALLGLLVDPGRAKVTASDPLYLRLLDVPRALEARRYAADGELVLGVEDLYRPGNTGRWRLVVRDGEARCDATDADPQLRFAADTLASVSLGGVRSAALLAAGRIDGEAAAAFELDRMTATSLAPWHGGMF